MRLFPLLIALLLAACGGSPEVDALLAVADSLSGVKPDSALRLLQEHEADVPYWSKSQRIRGELLRARAMNKAYVDFTTDSIIKEVADYYDRHGTANEQMEAHYLLGCVYRDLGEAPRAIEAYQDAVARADTLAQDCDHALLCRIYSQMAAIFYQQNLMRDNLYYLDQSIKYAKIARDSVSELRTKGYRMAAFERLGLPDSALLTYEQINHQFGGNERFQQEIAAFSSLAIGSLLETGQFEKARQCMTLYESESGFFDADGNIQKGRETYYNLRGRYHLSVMEYDSANFYFRKELEAQDYNNRNGASKGLTLMFQKIGMADSTAKYALYCYEMNDSVYAQMATEEVEKTKTLYNYGRYLHEAQIEKERADRHRVRSITSFVILITFIIVIVFLSLRAVRKRKEERRRTEELAKQLGQAQQELEQLKKHKAGLEFLERMSKDVINLQKEQLDTLRKHEADLSSLITRKEAEMERLKKELLALRRRTYIPIDFVKMDSLDTRLPDAVRKCIKKCIKMSENDWIDTIEHVRKERPNLLSFILDKKKDIGIQATRICILLGFNVRIKEIATLMGVEPPYISKMSSSILEKVWSEDGSSKELRNRLAEIL